MAVPKQKPSRSKQRKQRTHWKLDVPALSDCPSCGQLRVPHRICGSCGMYRGRRYPAIAEKRA